MVIAVNELAVDEVLDTETRMTVEPIFVESFGVETGPDERSRDCCIGDGRTVQCQRRVQREIDGVVDERVPCRDHLNVDLRAVILSEKSAPKSGTG